MKRKKVYKFRGADGRTWKLEADPAEVFPDDPGNGTPLLVIAPNGETSTLNCTLGEGEISGDGQQVPDDVLAWLASIEQEAADYAGC